MDFVSAQSTPAFDTGMQEKLQSGATPAEEVSGEDEELVEKCLEIIRQEKRASTSLLQRRLRLGYTRAARIVDILEQRGILGPGEGAKPVNCTNGKSAVIATPDVKDCVRRASLPCPEGTYNNGSYSSASRARSASATLSGSVAQTTTLGTTGDGIMDYVYDNATGIRFNSLPFSADRIFEQLAELK